METETLLSVPALVAYAFAVVLLLTSAILVRMTRSAQSTYTAPDTVLFSRGPAKMIGGALVVAVLVCAAPLIVAVVNDEDASFMLLLVLFLLAFFAFVWWCQFLATTLVFYVADSSGLTRRWLNATTTLPWHEIDWVYGAANRTNYMAYGIVKVGQSTQHTVMVEAGPGRKIKIVVKAWLIGGTPEALLQAVEQCATNAQFGYDKSPLVIARRMAATGVPRY
jgi:hypothetical protein